MPTTTGTLKHRHQTALPNNPGPDVSANAWNAGMVLAGGSDGLPFVRDSTQQDGWGWGVANNVVNALGPISQSVQGSTQNLTAAGPFDWALFNSATTPRQNSSQHGKSINGHLVQTFDWVQSASAGSNGIFTFSSGVTYSATPGDDIGAPLSGAQLGAAINNGTTGAINLGWRMAWPIMASQRTMTVWCFVFSGTGTFTASFASGAVSPVTSTLSTAAGASGNAVFSFTFQGAPGDWLNMTFLLTTNLGSFANVGLGWAGVS